MWRVIQFSVIKLRSEEREERGWGAYLLAEVDFNGGVRAGEAQAHVGVDAQRLDAVAVAVHDRQPLLERANISVRATDRRSLLDGGQFVEREGRSLRDETVALGPNRQVSGLMSPS